MRIKTVLVVASFIAGTNALPCRAQLPSAQPASLRTEAWNILDTFWTHGTSPQKECVLGSLAYVESDRAIEPFLDALRSENPGLAGRSARLLPAAHLNDAAPVMIARLAKEKNDYVAIQLMSRLREIHTNEVANAVLRFAVEDRPPLTGVAFGVLQAIGAAGVPALEIILRSGCDSCRETAAFLLIKRTEPDAIRSLKAALPDLNPRVRAFAAIGLARNNDPAGKTILDESLKSTDAVLRVWSAVALYRSGPRENDADLIACLKDPSATVRRIATKEICALGDPRLRTLALGIAQRDESTEVRATALEEKDDETPKRLRVAAFLTDPDLTLRILAIDAASRAAILHEETDRAMRSLPNSISPAQEYQILAVISRSKESAQRYSYLIEHAMRSPDPNTQAAAIGAAAMLGRPAIQEISPWLESNDVFLSATAAKALTDISPVAALPLLDAGTHSARTEVKIVCAGYMLRALELAKGSEDPTREQAKVTKWGYSNG